MFFARRAVVATAIVAAGCVMACGCSVLSPADGSWEGGYGEVTGTVTNRVGTPLDEISVSMWAEVGVSQTETTYEVTTDGDGCFVISDVDLGGQHAYSQTYEIYVNCMKVNRAAVNIDYTTHVGSVTVEQSEDCTVVFELSMVDDGPGDPSSTFE